MSNSHVHLHKDKFQAHYDGMLPSPHRLIVSGEVDGDYRVKSVKLVRAQIQGINPKELILDIEAELSPEPDPGQAVPHFLRTIEVSYREQDVSDQYLSVLVRSDSDQVQLRIEKTF